VECRKISEADYMLLFYAPIVVQQAKTFGNIFIYLRGDTHKTYSTGVCNLLWLGGGFVALRTCKIPMRMMSPSPETVLNLLTKDSFTLCSANRKCFSSFQGEDLKSSERCFTDEMRNGMILCNTKDIKKKERNENRLKTKTLRYSNSV
jgi:hypothetical protein